MENDTRDNKNTSVGSIYFNTKKGADQADKDKLKKCVAWLKEKEFFLSVSIKEDGNSDYTKYTAFPNGFKKSDKDPDMKIKASTIGSSAPAPKKAAKQDDDIPF